MRLGECYGSRGTPNQRSWPSRRHVVRWS